MNKGKLKISIIIPVLLFATGLSLHFALGLIKPVWFSFPINLIIVLELLFGIPLIYFFYKNKKVVQFLSSGVAAIPAIAFFSILVIIMAFLPQEKESFFLLGFFGFNNIIFTWYFSLSAIYLLICLGFVILRRFNTFNLRNIAFFINHFGLWIVIAAGFAGQADKIKLNFPVSEGALVWYGFDEENKYVEPDFAIKLIDFNIEYYNPKIGVFSSTGELTGKDKSSLNEIHLGEKLRIDNFDAEILEILPTAWVSNDSVYAVIGIPETVIAVHLLINDGSKSFEKWIYTGSSMIPAGTIKTKNGDFIALIPPEPKYFGSEIELYTKSGISAERHEVAVNKPLKFGSWTVYQSSYYTDTQSLDMVSVFSAVFDPWLPIVYTGMFMMMAGALYLMFSKIKTVKKD